MHYLKKRASCILLLALLAPFAHGQIQSGASTRFIVEGIKNPKQVGDMLLVDPDSKPKLVPVGFVVVDATGMVTVKASDSKRNPVEVRRVDPTKFLVLGQGRLWVDITVIDFETQYFDQKQFVLDVGDAPEPEPDEPDEPDNPEPSPNVPTDDYDNLGQRIDVAADAANLQVDKRQRVAEVYRGVAKRMASFELKLSSDAAEAVTEAIAAMQLGAEWAKVFGIAEADKDKRGALTWDQIIAWYTAIANGLEG